MAALGRPAVADDPFEQRAVYDGYLADPAVSILVAELDGAICGAASIVVRPRLNWITPEAWIADLVVRPADRRRGVGRALVDAAPYRESGYRLLMETLNRQGNRAEALMVYDRLRVRLREDLGTTPSPETQDLHRRLLG